MKKFRISCFIVILIMLLSSCSGKKSDISISPNSNPTSLWLVTEETVSDGMNYQTQAIIEKFKQMHPDVIIHMDVLPTEEHKRNLYLSELYTRIDKGKGPDIFLLPTSDILTVEEPTKYTYLRISPLFPDVNIAMRQGYFMDLSEWYDSDNSLRKDSLNSTVMNAGIINNARYTIPLRYEIPVLYIWDNYFKEHELNSSSCDSSIKAWMEYVTKTGDSILACGAEYTSVQNFSNLIDYENMNVTLSQHTAEAYLKLYQQVETLIGTEIRHRSSPSLCGYLTGDWNKFPAQINMLGHALTYAAIAEVEGEKITMYPLCTMEGDCIATIKYYAAIGANCENPAIAYELIRQFLLEEYQWEQSRPKPETEQYEGLIENSWPVRTKGSVEALWNNRKMQASNNIKGDSETHTRQEEILNLKLTDSSLPILETEINSARFPVYLSPPMGSILSQLNDYKNGNQPTNIDISNLAKELISNLEKSIL